MKKLSLLLALLFTLCSCSGQHNDADKLKRGIQQTMKEHSPGSISTSVNGYTMRAKIDGKNWTAVSMMPIKGIDRVIGYAGNGSYIGLGVTAKEKQGNKRSINESNGADLNIQNDPTLIDKAGNVILLDKTSGKIEITKQDGHWMEGTFYFTATSSMTGKKIQVTDGYFRIPLTP